MSNTPGLFPITPDIEAVRHSDEDGEDMTRPAADDEAGTDGEDAVEVERRPDR